MSALAPVALWGILPYPGDYAGWVNPVILVGGAIRAGGHLLKGAAIVVLLAAASAPFFLATGIATTMGLMVLAVTPP